MAIFNMTQHAATADQLAVGVVDYPEYQARGRFLSRSEMVELLTFEKLPTAQDLERRATWLAEDLSWRWGDGASAMIGGAPFFMPVLERKLKEYGIKVLYAFSKRESVEEQQPDGSVIKRNTFRHAGFVEA